VEFKEATDRLRQTPTLQDIGEALGVSWIRQARVRPDSGTHRPAPHGWEKVVVRLARERATELERLAVDLERAE